LTKDCLWRWGFYYLSSMCGAVGLVLTSCMRKISPFVVSLLQTLNSMASVQLVLPGKVSTNNNQQTIEYCSRDDILGSQ
jgi:hypothetical protein